MKESLTEIDVEYVRATGEEVQRRLFPRPKVVKNEMGEVVDGPTPVPLPVLLRYVPYGDDASPAEILFVPSRSVQHVGMEARVVSLSLVSVFVDGMLWADADLTFGQDPLVEEGIEESLSVAALLRAITGTF